VAWDSLHFRLEANEQPIPLNPDRAPVGHADFIGSEARLNDMGDQVARYGDLIATEVGVIAAHDIPELIGPKALKGIGAREPSEISSRASTSGGQRAGVTHELDADVARGGVDDGARGMWTHPVGDGA
jgi:hypothetical protein